MIKVPKEFDAEEYRQWALDNIYYKMYSSKGSKTQNSIFNKLREHIQNDQMLNKDLRNYLLVESNLINLLVGSPKEILNSGENLEGELFTKHFVKTRYPELRTEFGGIISKKLNLRICPYCNRAYTFSVQKNLGGNTKTFQLDHIYPKEKYPYLAINIFNLVPVCAACNHDKLNFSDEFINPFEQSWDKSGVAFKWKYSDETERLVELIPHTEDFEIYINHKDIDFVKNSIQALGLEEIYSEHKTEALEIIKLAQKYNTSYIEELSKYEGLNLNEFKIKRDLLGPNLDAKDHHKRPLAKFTRDIAEDVGFLKPVEPPDS